MPRRKVKTISAKELMCFETIVSELEARDDFDGYDFSTLTLSVKYEVEPTIRPENLKKAIDNIERYVAMNCTKREDFIVRVSSLAKVAKVSRPTMTRWCADGFIRPEIKRITFVRPPDDLYDLEVVLDQLRSLK